MQLYITSSAGIVGGYHPSFFCRPQTLTDIVGGPHFTSFFGRFRKTGYELQVEFVDTFLRWLLFVACAC